MGTFLYYLLLKPLSLLPLRLLYVLSDGMYQLLYHVVGYRKQVVRENLRRSFPERSEAEIEAIAQRFFRRLCDLIMESVKLFSISEAELMRRCEIKDASLPNHYAAQGRSVIIFAGHYHNWEISAAASDRQMKHQTVGAYVPLSDAFMDRVAKASRSRFGLIMISVKAVRAFFETHQGPPIAMLFAGDQSPRRPERAHWMTFLNQDTGVMKGTENYARQHDLPVIYGRILRPRRGYYAFEFELVTDTPQATEPGFITEACTHLLEADILREPSAWLWSHRRWKHRRPVTPPPEASI
jgi:KDO2-lipid IV(A) lauroyltransferase